MRKLFAFALVVAMASLGVPSLSIASPRPQESGQIVGSARTSSGMPLPGATVRLRNTATGGVVQTVQAGADGQFTFGAVPPGTYVVELVGPTGTVVATSGAVALIPGAMNSGGMVLMAPAGMAGAPAAAAAAGSRGFFASPKGIALLAAIGGGAVAGIVAASGSTTSPSR